MEVVQVAPTEGAIETVLPRHSRFSRQQPRTKGQWREDVLIANLDQVVTVFAVANPPFNARMLDRFLLIAEHNESAALMLPT
ncbi:MAG: GTPase RsgA, partial [Chloroflexaceae bacterium]|nr:GTPase RsgA [Chloroflexaceae bacterium]